jgi:hypothetical protein
MDDTASSVAPRHPELERRSLIAWPGYRSGLPISSFDRRVVGAIAKPLAHAVLDPGYVSTALKAGLGVVLPAQTWRNQLPLDHPKRTGAFAELRVHRPGVRFAPDEALLRPGFAQRYATDHIAAELESGATIATTPGHVLEHEGGQGRQNELLLARLTVEEFGARRASSPAPGQRGSRTLYATIVLQGRHAAIPGVIEWLVNSYADLSGIGGYWIVAVNTTQSARQLAAYSRLALRLQELTERPAVVSCVGDAQLALLASGVAATCAGLHGMSFRYPPASLPESDDEDEEETGLGVHVYHRAVLGSAGPLGAAGDRVGRALFLNRPCPCGHHPAAEPPSGKRQTVAHNFWSISADACDFALPVVSVAEARLATRVTVAKRTRALVKMSRLRPGFASVPREAARFRDQDEDAAASGTD